MKEDFKPRESSRRNYKDTDFAHIFICIEVNLILADPVVTTSINSVSRLGLVRL